MNLDDLIGRYARPDLRRSTVAGHLVSLRALRDSMRGGRTLARIARGDVVRCLEGGTQGGWSKATTAKHARYLHAAFAYAVRMGWCDSNPATNLGVKQSFRAKEWQYVTSEAVKGAIERTENVELRAALALARWAGLRINEALRTEWCDVDLAARTLTVHPTPDDNGRREEGTKGHHRVVPLDPRIIPFLVENGDDKVCGTLIYRQYNRLVKRVATWQGAPWHTLRKSCGMDWADLVPIHTVADWMGNGIVVASRHYLKPHAKHFEIVSRCVDIGGANPIN